MKAFATDIAKQKSLKSDIKYTTFVVNASARLEYKYIQKICILTEKAWGKFPVDFISEHIFREGNVIVLSSHKDDLVGYSAVSKKEVAGKKIYYIEFTVIKKEYQGNKLGTELTARALRKILVASPLETIELMFLTPNIRTVATLAKVADFIYPNPYLASEDGRIAAADDQTWKMARDLIAKSDNPTRTLEREGLVLLGSYSNQPWLINRGDNIPWHRDDKINRFARYYLKYGIDNIHKADKELVVRARISWKGVVRSIFS